MELQNIITIAGGVLSLGIVYGSIRTAVKQLENRIETLERHSDTIIEVKTKLDLLITHFLNKNDK